MKPVAKGDIISVVFLRAGVSIVFPVVVKKWGPVIRGVWFDQLGERHIFTVRRNSEGRRWARGVDGPAVEALRSYMALT